MIQEVSIVSDPVMLHVWSCLHNYAYDDALFAAERLFAETKSSESLHLLATSLYRVGRPKQVSRLLKSFESLSPKSRYLLCKCSFDFGLVSEAEEALIGHSLSPKPLDELTEIYGEQATFAILLLGNIRRRQGRITDAIACYKKCLELNPLMWTAFKNLCDIGEFPSPSTVFHLRDGLCLPTSTYKYVCSSANPNVVHSESQSSLSKATDGTVEFEEIFSRENVNPERLTAPVVSDSAKTLTKSPGTVDRAFVTHYFKGSEAMSQTNFNRASDFSHTPEEKFLLPTVPRAPKPINRNFSKNMHCDKNYGLCQPLSTSPQFGNLALIAQSSLFACVPVFHKPQVCPTVVDSFFSGSSRFGNHTLPLRHSTLNESVPASTNGRSSNVDLPSCNTNVTRRRSRLNDNVGSDAPAMQSVCSNSVTNVPVHLRSSGERTTTSTPACTAASLRRLIIAESPNSNPAFNNTTLPSSSVGHGSPSVTRCEPPVLRSASQRTTSLGNTVSARQDVQILNVNSPIAISSSSTSRSPLTPQSRRLNADASIFEECQSTGPRTRSQVAAAAALARASGLQRRSDRLSRNKVTPKKMESKQTNKESVSASDEGLIDNFSTIEPNGTSSDVPVDSNIAAFGDEPHSKDIITMEIPVSGSGDPRVSSLRNYLYLLSELGSAYELLVQHNWKSATRLISKLPITQLSTGRMLSWAARAHMDNADYATAKKLFSEVRRIEPWQLLGMDFYSTVLWQLQADHELSLLAHELLQLDRNAPEPWCAAGNCFSLQGEHELAIRFLQRAIQVCPTSAYAFTLLGHEQSTLEDFDRALNSFRHALRLDPRHYNALFGMSNVYYKQERFDLADSHLSRAVALFPQSHLLLTNLGALRGRLGHLDDGPDSALALVTRACKIQPNNPLARYHRSSILFHLGRYTEVLAELQKLLVLTPREAMVYLMIGHTHKKLGNTPQAMIHYSWAMGLDPKGANTHLRDIMTNPPVTGRNSARCSVGANDTTGIENGTGIRQNTRSRLAVVRGEVNSDDDLRNDDSSMNDSEFLDTELPHITDETMSGLLNSSQFAGSMRTRETRRLTDFSLLFGAGTFDDAVLSGVDDEDQQETMDLSGELDGANNGHSPVDE